MAMLALVIVAEQDIFPRVPEAELFALLILFTDNLRILEQLRIELRHFHNNLPDGEDGAYKVNGSYVRIDLLSDRRCKPSVFLGRYAVVKPCSTVTELAAPARAP